ncbi:MAG: sigma-54-dependent Fis family transcriptional regulator [Deltaproteobacteria bacterium]|nr:MAG: sigma-54-dependent Fis family transcriptional regulator [Deltaproteobacteria bacterium]
MSFDLPGQLLPLPEHLASVVPAAMPRRPSSTPPTDHAQTDHSSSQSTPPWTPPLDEAQCEPWYDGDDAVVALREYNSDQEYDLPLHIKSFRLGGSRSCEVSVPGRGLSAVHCLLERRGSRFLVHDQHSTHGTIHDGRRIQVADLQPGDRFTAVPVTFLVLNNEIRIHRPLLVELLGTDFAPWSPDRLVIEAAKGLGNLLLTGEAGCEHERLARAIHAMSLLRNRPLIECSHIPAERPSQVGLIKRASRSTFVLSLTSRTPPIEPTFASMLFSPSYHVRVIVIAPSLAVSRRVLPAQNVDQMQHVWIRPIAARARELPAIFDRLLSEGDAPIRLANLTEANRARLLSHAWRGNWEDVRMAANRLTSIARIPDWEELDWRERAIALGIAKSTLYDWYKLLQLTKPLFAKSM